jgi:hypothetical protein
MRVAYLEGGNGAVIYIGREPVLFAEFNAYWRCDHAVQYFERMPRIGTDTWDDIAFLKTHTMDDFLSKLRAILDQFDPDILENYA